MCLVWLLGLLALRLNLEAVLVSVRALRTAFAEFVRVRGGQDPCPEEAALAREAYNNMLTMGLSSSPQVQNATRSTAGTKSLFCIAVVT